jgi:hypothetical protein
MGKGKGERAPATILVSYMPAQGYVFRNTFRNTHGRNHPTYTVNAAVLQECWGTTEWGLHLTVKLDNDAGLAWLEDALAYAFMQRRSELWAYLEALMDEVLLEVELEVELAARW